MADLLFRQSPLSQPSLLLFGNDEDTIVVVPPVIQPDIYNPSGDLLFSDTLATSGNLIFGNGDVVVAVPDITYTISASFPALSLLASVAPVSEIQIQSSFPAVNIIANALYDSDTERPVVSRLQTTFNAAIKLASANGSAVRRLQHASSGITTAWTLAQSLRFGASQDIQQLSRLHHVAELAWANAVPLRSTIQSHFNDLLKNTAIAQSAFSDAWPVQITRHIRFADRLRHRSSVASHWRSALSMRFAASDQFSSGIAYRLREAERFQTARVPPIGISYVPSVKPPIVYVGDANLVFAEPATTSASLVFGNTYVIPGSTIVVPVKRSYIVINNSTLQNITTGENIPVVDMNMTIDMDSWTWGFGATIPDSAYSSVARDSNGNPPMLEAMINGVPYRVIAESISRSRAFGKSTYSVTGRGISAELSDSYVPVMSFGNAATRTAQQLMNDVLTLNGQPIGWTIDWKIDDWLVAAGTFSHQGSYMSAINSIAQSAGAFISPDNANRILRVLPRMPVPHWLLANSTPDIVLPSDPVIQESTTWEKRPAYDSIYVSGTTSAGVLAKVRKTGSGGINTMPMATDPLITDVKVARQRGISELSKSGSVVNYQLNLPILTETGIITPGKVIRYVDNGNLRTGLSKSVSVNVALPTARQTINIVTYD